MSNAYRYRNPEKRRAYVRERMRAHRLWNEHKYPEAFFFREWVNHFVKMIVAI